MYNFFHGFSLKIIIINSTPKFVVENVCDTDITTLYT
jgi:hypothetical protein